MTTDKPQGHTARHRPEHCPRWRDGRLIDERHCALDFVEEDDDGI